MNESAVYNETDLAPFHKRLAELRQIVQQDAESSKHPKAITKLLERQLNDAGMFLDFISSEYPPLTMGSPMVINRRPCETTTGLIISVVT